MSGSVMKGSYVEGASQVGRRFNAVPLENAVLCAECDVVSDSPHDACLVCGSRSLLNIARMLGGNLPRDRARLVLREPLEMKPHESVLAFPKPHRPRRKAALIASSAPVVARDNETDELEGRLLFGSHG